MDTSGQEPLPLDFFERLCLGCSYSLITAGPAVLRSKIYLPNIFRHNGTFAFCLLPFAFCLLPFAFCILHFAFCILHYTLANKKLGRPFVSQANVLHSVFRLFTSNSLF